MDLNLPLILFVLVAASGVIWLFDWLFLSKTRKEAIAAVEKEYQDIPETERESNSKYVTSIERVSAEPPVVEYAKSFFPVLFLVFVLRSFLVEPFQIPSESMVPTLKVGDFILVNKFKYGIRLPIIRKKVMDISDPRRGDVMVFFPPHESRYFIKRVAGVPGDNIQLVDNVLYINGNKISQELQVTEPFDPSEQVCGVRQGKYEVLTESLDGERTHSMRKCVSSLLASRDGFWQVPEGHYFMMGDNRDNSLDSRAWGFVPEERIVGKAFAIWMHWETFFSIPKFSRVGTI